MNTQVSCGRTDGTCLTWKAAEGGAPQPKKQSEYQASPAGRISEAASHLRVALLQIEDEIVKQHVCEALKLLEAK